MKHHKSPSHRRRVIMPGDDSAAMQREARAEALERLRMETEAKLWVHRPIR